MNTTKKENNGVLVSIIGMKDRLKKDVYESFRRIEDRGIGTKILTSDDEKVSVKIAQDVGVIDNLGAVDNIGYEVL